MIEIWVLVALYAISYILVFCFPSLIHRKRQFPLNQRLLASPKIAVIGHRGGLMENFENSMKAFMTSADCGADGMEMDLHRTKDGQLVVEHDFNLVRLTGQDREIADTLYSEIGPYLNEVPSGYAPTKFVRVNQDKERPPRFEDVLIALKNRPQVFLNVDIKTNRSEDLVEACELLTKHGYQERAIVGYVENETAKFVLAERGHRYPVFFTSAMIGKLFASVALGVFPFVNFDADVFEMTGPFKTMLVTEYVTKHRYFELCFLFIRRLSWVARAINWHFQRRGMPVFYWTLNGTEDYQFGRSLNCNGIITDYPSQLRKFVNACK